MLSYLFGSDDSNKYVNCRELKDFNSLVIVLFEDNNKHEMLCFSGPETELYKNISMWCDVNTDLKSLPETSFKQTENEILYDPKSECFINLEDSVFDDFTVYPYLDNIYPKELSAFLEFNTTLVREEMFPSHLIDKLEKLGTISPRLVIKKKYLADGYGNQLV